MQGLRHRRCATQETSKAQSQSLYRILGWISTNIFRIWIPHRGEVISSRDVIFDEDEFFDGTKVDLNDNLAMTLDEYVHQVRLPEQVSRNEVILQEDDEIVDWDLGGSDQPDGLSDDGEQLEIERGSRDHPL